MIVTPQEVTIRPDSQRETVNVDVRLRHRSTSSPLMLHHLRAGTLQFQNPSFSSFSVTLCHIYLYSRHLDQWELRDL